jgi:hypothetical protein
MLMFFVVGRPTAAHAQYIVAQHTGTNNPTSEGWTLTGGTIAGSPTNINGTGAWDINDNSTTDRGRYEINPTFTATQSNLLVNSGWRLGWGLDIVRAASSFPSRTIEINPEFGTTIPGGKRYQIQYGTNGTSARLFITTASGTLDITTASGTGVGFHNWDLFGNPQSGDAKLYVDGTFVTNFIGAASTTTRIYWGSVDDANTGDSAWSYVYLEVPEPSTLALIGFTLAGVPWLRRRRR